MSVLSIEAVDKSWFGRKVLNQISLRVDKGEKIALVGENGSGKTTLFRLIQGLESIDQGRIILASGTVPAYLSQSLEPLESDDETALDNPLLRSCEERLRSLEQEISSAESSDQEKTALAQYTAVTSEFESLGGYDYAARLSQVLAELGFKGDHLNLPLTALSGGERMRVAMARMLVSRADLLLLDEPTNHLDLSAIEWLEDYINRFRGTVLFISHDRSFIENCATQVAELAHSKLKIYSGNYSRYLLEKEIQEDYARQSVKRLKEAVKTETQVVQTMLSHRDFGAYHSREKKLARLTAELEEIKEKISSGPAKMNFHFVPTERSGDPNRQILEVDGLSKAYDGRRLFSNVSFTLRANEHIVIAGPNGCGKTTLLRQLMGQDTEHTGIVKVSKGIRFAAMGQYVPFEDESLTVYQELERRSNLVETELRSRLARFSFTDVTVFKQISVLSGGERSRLYLCCLLEENPDLLYLDEPTNHLDIHSRDILENALTDFTGAILAVSHDRYFIDKLADRVLGFHDREVRAYFSYDKYRRAVKNSNETKQDPGLPARESKQDTYSASRSADNPAVIRRNKAEQRRHEAKQRNQLKSLENQLGELENEKAELERSIQVDTTPEIYQRLADIIHLLDVTQESYLNLAIEIEGSGSE